MWPNLTEFCFSAKSFPDTCKRVWDCTKAKVLVISSDICQTLNQLSHYIIHFRFFNNKETEWEIEKNINWVKISIRLEKWKAVNMCKLTISSIDKIINWYYDQLILTNISTIDTYINDWYFHQLLIKKSIICSTKM